MARQETTYVTYIAASPRKIWAALTTPEATRQYFFGRHVESSWRIGAPFKLWMPDGRMDTKGKVLECDPPRLLSVTWHVEWIEELRKLPEAIVTFQLDSLGNDLAGLTRLTMTEFHPELVDERYLEGGRQGWPVILSGLKTLVETGKPLPKYDWAALEKQYQPAMPQQAMRAHG